MTPDIPRAKIAHHGLVDIGPRVHSGQAENLAGIRRGTSDGGGCLLESGMFPFAQDAELEREIVGPE